MPRVSASRRPRRHPLASARPFFASCRHFWTLDSRGTRLLAFALFAHHAGSTVSRQVHTKPDQSSIHRSSGSSDGFFTGATVTECAEPAVVTAVIGPKDLES